MNESLSPRGTAGADAHDNGAGCLTVVRKRLVNMIEHESLPDYRKGRKGLTIEELAYAGQVLGQLGDTRPGVGVKDGLPDIDWIKIPAGKFLMGDEGSWHGGGEFKCGLIKSSYHIGRYPITVTQYQIFVNDKGYEEESFWTKAGWQWRTEREITGPEDEDNPVFQTPNHPRVGVNWYEAVAFCRWLSDKLQGDIRLPSEAEWERAARGKRGRPYPWGNATNFVERCNCAKTELDQTSAVGLFPSGDAECGAADLAGNVWEWCRTGWLDDYEDYEKRVNDDLEGNNARVLRGGSWRRHDRDRLVSSRRLNHGPVNRNGRGGFRCVWVGAPAR